MTTIDDLVTTLRDSEPCLTLRVPGATAVNVVEDTDLFLRGMGGGADGQCTGSASPSTTQAVPGRQEERIDSSVVEAFADVTAGREYEPLPASGIDVSPPLPRAAALEHDDVARKLSKLGRQALQLGQHDQRASQFHGLVLLNAVVKLQGAGIEKQTVALFPIRPEAIKKQELCEKTGASAR